jgi:hypothetical protein
MYIDQNNRVGQDDDDDDNDDVADDGRLRGSASYVARATWLQPEFIH